MHGDGFIRPRLDHRHEHSLPSVMIFSAWHADAHA